MSKKSKLQRIADAAANDKTPVPLHKAGDAQFRAKGEPMNELDQFNKGFEELMKKMGVGRNAPRYFRMDGTPYEGTMAGIMFEWCKDFENVDRILGRTRLWWGANVSTVWLGLDHGWRFGPPLIFETMVFRPWGMRNLDVDRYSTKEEAMAGHRAMCKKWSNPLFALYRIVRGMLPYRWR